MTPRALADATTRRTIADLRWSDARARRRAVARRSAETAKEVARRCSATSDSLDDPIGRSSRDCGIESPGAVAAPVLMTNSKRAASSMVVRQACAAQDLGDEVGRFTHAVAT
jgi:hypothetical protein